MRFPLAALLLVILALGGCFSRPELVNGDDGVGDGGAGDAPDGGCMPAVVPEPAQLSQLELVKVSAGASHVCAIDTSSGLWCWGKNNEGQLGARTDSPGDATGVPGRASPLMGWSSVAAAPFHTCGIAGDKVYCWGRNDEHQCSPTSTSPILPTEVTLNLPMGETPVSVFAGPTLSCVRTSTSRVLCWGKLDLTGSNAGGPLPLVASDNSTWTTMAIGDNHACAVASGGALYCWGSNSRLQLGTSDSSIQRGFAQLARIDPTGVVSAVAVSDDATCATSTAGLVCFGSGGLGHLGGMSGDSDNVLVSTAEWSQVALGYDHVCAIDASADVHCYGDSVDGALGSGLYAKSPSFGGAVMSNATAIVAGDRFSCALDTAKHLWCWGASSHGELGTGAVASKRDPATALLPVGSCESVLQLAVGDRHTCALVAAQGEQAGRLYCWGENAKRQITGSSAETSLPVPTQVFPQDRFTHVALGEMHTCALRSDGAIRCWGDNSASQLGATGALPTTLSVPGRQVMPWIYVAAGSRATCAISLVGELYCWGAVPGAGPTPAPTSFGSPGGGMHWESIALGSGFGIGTAFDPQTATQVHVYAFADSGKCLTAALPQGPLELAVSAPGESHMRVTVAAAQFGGDHACMHFLESDGSNKVLCIGNNGDYQTAPVGGAGCQMIQTVTAPTDGWQPVLTGVSTVTVARTHSCALDGLGKPWCWGANNSLELGALPNRSSTPARVTDQRFAELSTGGRHTCGVRDDRRTVTCWGENRDGQIGDGTRFYPSPTKAALVAP